MYLAIRYKYVRSAQRKPAMILGTGCLGRWREAKFNIGSSFRDDFVFYVSPYMLVIRYCNGLWDERKNKLPVIITARPNQ